jgi:pyruvate dehydrogenase E1 component alpha subunit
MTEMLPEAHAWRLMETMLLMRRFEEAVLQMAAEKRFGSHYHLYIGQEATGAPAISALEARDNLATTHRNHGHIIARGADPGRALAEILGRATGLNGGRSGTLHLCEPALGFLSTSAVVGGCISLSVGGGYACKQRGDGSVMAGFFGDGALEEGVSFEALNIASLWKLPVIFVCENNSIDAWGTAKDGFPTLVHASKDLGSIARSVDIATVRLDGIDAAAVHAAMTDAVARCRSGAGPVFIEAVTKRWAGSNPLWPEPTTGTTDLRMAWGEAAVTGEHREWYAHFDPVLRLARHLAESGGTKGVERLKKLDREVQARMQEAVKFAVDSPMPAPESALEHVYA